MTNVLKFPATRPEPVQAVAPDKIYFVSCLRDALEVAGLVYKDTEAVDMLMAELRCALVGPNPIIHLSLEVRTRCAPYLSDSQSSEQWEADIDRAIQVMYNLSS